MFSQYTKKIIFRFRQFGGGRMIAAYFKLGVGEVVLKQMLRIAFRICAADDAYSAIRRDVNEILQKQYEGFLLDRKGYYDKQELSQKHSNRVWVCWLQGFEQAPELVKVCVASMRKYLTDKEITLLSYDNYQEYVKLPVHIVQLYEKGKMPAALFSDLLRLEVLIQHGGTWMDATMLVTGNHYPKEMVDCDLFMFQALRKGDSTFYGTSNWFITACSNNRLLLVLRDVLHQYWREYSVTLNYYMFHDFFYTIGLLYPKEIAAMPRKNRLLPLYLMQRMGDKYDTNWMEELTKRCCFHKLNYRLSNQVLNDGDNFYHAVLNLLNIPHGFNKQ